MTLRIKREKTCKYQKITTIDGVEAGVKCPEPVALISRNGNVGYRNTNIIVLSEYEIARSQR